MNGHRSNDRKKIGDSTRLLVALLIVAALFPAAVFGAPQPAQSPLPKQYVGLSLTEALLALQGHGLKIAFTSHLVRPDMRVRAEPRATEPTAILEELLRPHGLKAQATPDGLYVVVPGPPPSSGLRGSARVRRTAVPLGGVRILIPDAGVEEVTGTDGLFSIADLEPGTYTVEAHLPGFVVERRPWVVIEEGLVTDLVFDLEPAPVPLDEIVVTPSQVSLLRSDPVAALAFDREEILAMPHLGDDLFRALTLLPGISGNELSAQFSIRGGRPDEVLVILDNLELFEPFHLKDFNNAFSIIAPRAIGEVDLIVGGFPVEYGDRMAGVLEMRTERPTEGVRSHLGIALLSAQAGSAGNLDDGRGDWLTVVRRGGTELAQDYLDEEEKPRFWDAFGKVTRRLGERGEIGLRVLHADDDLDTGLLVDEENDTVETLTGYGNSYVWLTHQAILSPRLLVDSALSVGRVRRDRTSMEEAFDDDGELEEFFTVADKRRLDVTGLKQAWNFRATPRHYLKWGFNVRRLDTEYDYVSIRELEDALEDLRPEPRSGETVFRERFTSDQYGVYVSDRMRLWEPLVIELGVRYDEQTITGDSNLSPRLNLVATLGETSSLRLAWGHYFQSQRIYELFVEDGETTFARAERTEEYGVGFEHLFAGGTILRVNAYHRDVTRPRPRFENVIEPISVFPEIEPDRVRIAPERANSQGIELFVRGRAGEQFQWWASYAYARVEDEIEGRDVPRGIDQPHTVNVDLSYRASAEWTLNLAWRYHTGWPTTAVTGVLEEDDEGELEPVLVFGPLNGERLSDYHRLDLRVSRRWQLKKRGSVTFFLELQNLYDRENLAGFDVDFDIEVTDGGQVVVSPIEEAWGAFLPSFGIDWEF